MPRKKKSTVSLLQMRLLPDPAPTVRVDPSITADEGVQMTIHNLGSLWAPEVARCGPCGGPALRTYAQSGVHVKQTTTCRNPDKPDCDWADGFVGMAHTTGRLLRWADGKSEAPETAIANEGDTDVDARAIAAAKKAGAVSTAETAAEAATVAAAPAAAGPTDSVCMELEPLRGNAAIAAFQAQVQAEGYHIHHHAYADGELVNCLPRRSHIQQYERDCLARGFGGELVIRSFGSKAQDCRKADGLLGVTA